MVLGFPFIARNNGRHCKVTNILGGSLFMTIPPSNHIWYSRRDWRQCFCEAGRCIEERRECHAGAYAADQECEYLAKCRGGRAPGGCKCVGRRNRFSFFSKQKYSSLENVCELKNNGPYRCVNELVSLKIKHNKAHWGKISHIVSGVTLWYFGWSVGFTAGLVI